MKNTTHGMSDTHIYGLYHHIKDRCYNPRHHSYKNYGGRGIVMCDEWLGQNGFEHFYDWAMNNGYQYGLTIDRIDNNGIYEPNNCRWITRSENVAKANASRRTQHRKADKGAYWAIDYEGNLYVFENAVRFGKEHGCSGDYVRNRARRGKLYKDKWNFGYMSEIKVITNELS